MAIITRAHDYRAGNTSLRATVAWDSSRQGRRPGVLVAHTWRGHSDFEDNKACELARLGYVGFAIDLYGKGKLGSSPEENAALMQPLLDDRSELQQRMRVALQNLRDLPEVDAQRTAGIGFCFGGLCVLDLARCGADLRGIVSFHGLLDPPGNPVDTPVSAKVLVLHGWDDPMATPDAVLSLASELSASRADWQLCAYGNTAHAFTNPLANDRAAGLVYSAPAERRAWRSMAMFLDECFE